MNQIDKGTRFTNYLTDYFAIAMIWFFLYVIVGDSFLSPVYYYLIMFFHYLTFEVTTRQTLGKMVTKTIVVDKNGLRPSIFKILFRSFLRLIPIDPFSYLFGSELGFHDSMSFTKLKKISNH